MDIKDRNSVWLNLTYLAVLGLSSNPRNERQHNGPTLNHTIIDDNWPYNPWCVYGKCISSHTSSMFDLIGMLDHSRISLTISNRPRNSRPFPGRLGLFPEHTRPSLIISWIFQTNSRPLGPFPGHLGLIFWQFWTIPWQFPGISGRFPPISRLSP